MARCHLTARGCHSIDHIACIRSSQNMCFGFVSTCYHMCSVHVFEPELAKASGPLVNETLARKNLKASARHIGTTRSTSSVLGVAPLGSGKSSVIWQTLVAGKGGLGGVQFPGVCITCGQWRLVDWRSGWLESGFKLCAAQSWTCWMQDDRRRTYHYSTFRGTYEFMNLNSKLQIRSCLRL